MDPGIVDAFSKLGALGFAIIAVWGFATGRVQPKSTIEANRLEDLAWIAELRAERDEWKAVAKASVDGLNRVTDRLESLARRLPPP